MKKFFIMMALLLTSGIAQVNAQTSVEDAAERAARKAEQVAQKAEEMSAKAEQAAQKAEETANGIVAYSDTTGAADSPDSALITINRGGRNVRISVPASWIDDDSFTTDDGSIQVNGMKELLEVVGKSLNDSDLESLTSGGMFGALGLLLLVMFVILLVFVVLPLIVVALILRRIIKNHNRSVDTDNERRATAYNTDRQQGEAFVDDDIRRNDFTASDFNTVPEKSEKEIQWERGIRNTSIGVGLAILFKLMGGDGLVGIGLLIAILGIGQLVIAKTGKSDF